MVIVIVLAIWSSDDVVMVMVIVSAIWSGDVW